jgi:3-oxo-5-alpha-steroid 4-dehydrogenase 1
VQSLLSDHPLYAYTLAFVLLFGATSFFVLLFISAPYGRHAREGWGPVIPARVAWVLMEAPSPIFGLGVFIAYGGLRAWLPTFLFAYFLVHYVDRAFIYPFRMKADGKTKPLFTVVLALVFNTCNGSLIGYALAVLSPHLTNAWLTDPRFLVGTALFVFGFVANRKSDAIVLALRAPGEGGYKIPRGFLFEYVSAPNYFAEIVEWIGFAIATWSTAGAAFAFFTITNLAPRAFSNHKWYVEKFPEYPRERKALIPFVL